MSGLPAPEAYRKAIRAASLPWNQRLEQSSAASTSKLDRPAACLNSRPGRKPGRDWDGNRDGDGNRDAIGIDARPPLCSQILSCQQQRE